MVVGIGLDIVELERVARWVSGDAEDRLVRLAERVLTDGEREIWSALATPRRKAEFLAGRFAAKEAVAKAFGCGIGGAVGFRDIEVLPDERGRPRCRLSAGAWQRLGLEEARHVVHVAITHEESVAAATAIVERR
jgi:holo-[acyl-carrier protein] synthase